MRKLKLQMQLSRDSYACGPNGELDWMLTDWDDELKKRIQSLTDPVDTILLGRKTADVFIPYWASVAADPANPEHAAGIKFTDTPKIVFSKSRKAIEGKNVTVLNDISDQTINALKALDGGDLMVYGGVETVAELFGQGLIDELYLFINPVVLGEGRSFFSVAQQQQLELLESHAFPCGIVMLVYRPQ